LADPLADSGAFDRAQRRFLPCAGAFCGARPTVRWAVLWRALAAISARLLPCAQTLPTARWGVLWRASYRALTRFLPCALPFSVARAGARR